MKTMTKTVVAIKKMMQKIQKHSPRLMALARAKDYAQPFTLSLLVKMSLKMILRLHPVRRGT